MVPPLPRSSPSRHASVCEDPRSYATIPYTKVCDKPVLMSSFHVAYEFRLECPLLHQGLGPSDDKLDLIYNIRGGDCDATYVGRTQVAEHK